MENQDHKKWRFPKLTKIQSIAALLVVCLVAGLGSYALASYVMTSNAVPETPQPKYTLTLTSNSTSPVIGVDVVNLTAVCNDNAFTGTVSFDSGVTHLGSVAAVAGVATIIWTPVAGTYSVVATATHS